MVFACAAAVGFLIGFLLIFTPFAFRNRAIAADADRAAQAESTARGELEEASRQAAKWITTAQELLDRRQLAFRKYEEYRSQLQDLDRRMQMYNGRIASKEAIEYAYESTKNLLANQRRGRTLDARETARVEESFRAATKQKQELEEAQMQVNSTERSQARVQGQVEDLAAQVAAFDRELAPYKDRLLALESLSDACDAAKVALEAAQSARTEAGKMLAIGSGAGALLGIVLALLAMALLKRFTAVRR